MGANKSRKLLKISESQYSEAVENPSVRDYDKIEKPPDEVAFLF